MSQICSLCRQEMAVPSQASEYAITHGICEACLSRVPGASGYGALLEAIDAPVLLMQGSPRQVVTVNARALELFEKELAEVEAHRGGQVFDCVHSFTAAGCGRDVNCENCTIKHAIVDTFDTAVPRHTASAVLQVKRNGGIESRTIQVSTEKLGDLALVRIESFDGD